MQHKGQQDNMRTFLAFLETLYEVQVVLSLLFAVKITYLLNIKTMLLKSNRDFHV
jgi:hypothetical protein